MNEMNEQNSDDETVNCTYVTYCTVLYTVLYCTEKVYETEPFDGYSTNHQSTKKKLRMNDAGEYDYEDDFEQQQQLNTESNSVNVVNNLTSITMDSYDNTTSNTTTGKVTMNEVNVLHIPITDDRSHYSNDFDELSFKSSRSNHSNKRIEASQNRSDNLLNDANFDVDSLKSIKSHRSNKSSTIVDPLMMMMMMTTGEMNPSIAMYGDDFDNGSLLNTNRSLGSNHRVELEQIMSTNANIKSNIYAQYDNDFDDGSNRSSRSNKSNRSIKGKYNTSTSNSIYDADFDDGSLRSIRSERSNKGNKPVESITMTVGASADQLYDADFDDGSLKSSRSQRSNKGNKPVESIAMAVGASADQLNDADFDDGSLKSNRIQGSDKRIEFLGGLDITPTGDVMYDADFDEGSVKSNKSQRRTYGTKVKVNSISSDLMNDMATYDEDFDIVSMKSKGGIDVPVVIVTTIVPEYRSYDNMIPLTYCPNNHDSEGFQETSSIGSNKSSQTYNLMSSVPEQTNQSSIDRFSSEAIDSAPTLAQQSTSLISTFNVDTYAYRQQQQQRQQRPATASVSRNRGIRPSTAVTSLKKSTSGLTLKNQPITKRDLLRSRSATTTRQIISPKSYRNLTVNRTIDEKPSNPNLAFTLETLPPWCFPSHTIPEELANHLFITKQSYIKLSLFCKHGVPFNACKEILCVDAYEKYKWLNLVTHKAKAAYDLVVIADKHWRKKLAMSLSQEMEQLIEQQALAVVNLNKSFRKESNLQMKLLKNGVEFYEKVEPYVYNGEIDAFELYKRTGWTAEHYNYFKKKLAHEMHQAEKNLKLILDKQHHTHLKEREILSNTV